MMAILVPGLVGMGWTMLLHRCFGRCGRHMRRRHFLRAGAARLGGRDLVVEFSARRATVAMAVFAAPLTSALAAASAIAALARAAFFTHFDVHHFAAGQFL